MKRLATVLLLLAAPVWLMRRPDAAPAEPLYGAVGMQGAE